MRFEKTRIGSEHFSFCDFPAGLWIGQHGIMCYLGFHLVVGKSWAKKMK